MSADRTLFEGEFVRLRRRNHWEYAERVNARGAVVIVALTPANELLLVEQPRFPVQAQVIELPAGLVGDIEGAEDEPMEIAGARELEEETGYRPARLEFLTAGPPSAGLANEVLSFYRAFDLVRIDAGGGDDSENIIPHAVPLSEVGDWLAAQQRAGKSVDPKVFAGLYFLLANL